MDKISEECLQNLVESMPRRIKAVLKAKTVQPDSSKVYLIKWQVSEYFPATTSHALIHSKHLWNIYTTKEPHSFKYMNGFVKLLLEW